MHHPVGGHGEIVDAGIGPPTAATRCFQYSSLLNAAYTVDADAANRAECSKLVGIAGTLPFTL